MMKNIKKGSSSKIRIKKNDEVIVISGNHKNYQGKVLEVLMAEGRVKIDGIECSKCVRPNPNKQEEGGVKKILKAIPISNVAIYNLQTKKADKIGYKTLVDGKKVRIYKSTNEQIEI